MKYTILVNCLCAAAIAGFCAVAFIATHQMNEVQRLRGLLEAHKSQVAFCDAALAKCEMDRVAP